MARRKEYKFDELKRAAYLENLRKGARRGAAADKVGISRAMVCEYKNNYPEFAVLVTQAEMDANELVENFLFQACEKLNVTAIVFWLMNRAGDRWTDKRAVASVNIGEGLSATQLREALNERGVKFEDRKKKDELSRD